MDNLAIKFYNMHNSLADIIKKLMKNNNCKDRVLLWMRQAVSLNMAKSKMQHFAPLASDGFILNYIDMLLILCKPFTFKFEKYANFLSKINCFYLHDDSNIANAKDIEKIHYEAPQEIQDLLGKGGDLDGILSGVTMNSIAEPSSLDADPRRKI